MNWYLAKIIYRIVCGDGDHKPQFDEQLRIIRAGSKREAFDKAVYIGSEEEVSFINDKQQPVKWEFINVAELYRLAALDDGSEIYSRLSETDNARTFIDITNNKAEQIRSSVAELI